MMQMRRTWLIQHLDRPMGPSILGRDNPFAFGGGLRNGGLSPAAMDLLRDLWSFDYMGAAEFEFGAVLEALQKIARAAEEGQLAATTFSIPLKDVAKDTWRDKSKKDPEGEATIYLLCPEPWGGEAQQRITVLARERWNPDLKESTRLAEVLRPVPDAEWTPDTCGWLELDNGFLFFTDRDMWAGACALFGVEIEVER